MISIQDPKAWSIVCMTRKEAERERLVRALTAQAWAVACMAWWTEEWAQKVCDGTLAPEGRHLQRWAMGVSDCSTKSLQRLAALPAPADLAAELMGPPL